MYHQDIALLLMSCLRAWSLLVLLLLLAREIKLHTYATEEKLLVLTRHRLVSYIPLTEQDAGYNPVP